MLRREKINDGGICFCTEEGFADRQTACLEKLYDFNNTRHPQKEERARILSEFFGEVGG